ncbi:type II toxin-antitoxin system ParD family antitoxin [Sphingomonas sp.]|uniref:type II toxin-antitoxin system ParD family antitoxin n=1 Tax=Sphingomonas sp. TaxID=28214 RepID=UPI0028A9F1E5|nr:type II toxin-antitoxin system ParD family antitoxin [Sphingomonas sp.]
MASMNISLPDPMRDFVEARIAGGHYASASDYVRDLIRRDQAQAASEDRWLRALDESIARGLTEVAAGQVHDLDDVVAALDAEIAGIAGASRSR